MSQFADTTQKLLQGVFICEYSHPAEFDFLTKPGMSQEVDGFLQKLNLNLSIMGDGTGFYCSYSHPKDNITQLKRQFVEITESMRPLVNFLIMVQQSRASDDVIRPGDVLRLAEIQCAVEDAPALALYLDKITAHALFKSASPTVDGKLKQVFKRLVELDYLMLSNPAHQIFLATHKWSLLVEQIRFIDETEHLSLASQAEDEQLTHQHTVYE